MKILLKLLLIPVALICNVLAFLIGLTGSMAQIVLNRLTGILVIFLLVSVFGKLGLLQIVTWSCCLFVTGLISYFFDEVPEFLENISARIFDL